MSTNWFAARITLLHDAIAIGPTAAAPSLTDTALDTAVRLDREILERQLVHRPLQPDVQLGHLAVGAGDDCDAQEAEKLIQSRGGLCVT